MTVYYEEIMELWKAEKFFEAIGHFSQWLLKGLLSNEEIENFSKNISLQAGFKGGLIFRMDRDYEPDLRFRKQKDVVSLNARRGDFSQVNFQAQRPGKCCFGEGHSQPSVRAVMTGGD